MCLTREVTNLVAILFKERFVYPELCNTYFSLQESSTNSSMIAGLASANEVQCIYCAVDLLIIECILYYIYLIFIIIFFRIYSLYKCTSVIINIRVQCMQSV